MIDYPLKVDVRDKGEISGRKALRYNYEGGYTMREVEESLFIESPYAFKVAVGTGGLVGDDEHGQRIDTFACTLAARRYGCIGYLPCRTHQNEDPSSHHLDIL